jgi:hypothetical protein
MIIKVVEMDEKMYEISCNSSDKLIDVLKKYSNQFKIRDYYLDDSCCMLNDCVPYIVRDGGIIWNAPYEDLTFDDIINTFPKVIDEGIVFEAGFPAAGGPGIIIGKAAALIFVQILAANYPEYGLAIDCAVIIAEAVCGLYEYYEKKEITVAQSLDAILESGETGIIAIEELMDYDQYHAVRLLNALGFKKNNETGRYEISGADKGKARAMIVKLTDNDLYHM